MFLVSGFLFLTLAGLSVNEIYRPHVSFVGNKSVEIQSGAGSRQVAYILKKEGIIRSKWIFVLYVALNNQASYLKPGNYIFFSNHTIVRIAGDLMAGGTNEIVITVPEGWTNKQIAELIASKGFFSKEAFLSVVGFSGKDYRKEKILPQPKDFSGTLAFLQDKPKYVGLEGFLFPDTYRLFMDSGPDDVIKKMLTNFGDKFSINLKNDSIKQKRTVFEVITMASLIEKEVISNEDRKIVSGILWKRLELGIPLQVDATITYLTGKKTTKITKSDLKIDSPYNTYKYVGLPLGPISNPGILAIEAAIYPQKSPYLFYLSTPEGKTIFSKTLEEHNMARAKYLQK